MKGIKWAPPSAEELAERGVGVEPAPKPTKKASKKAEG